MHLVVPPGVRHVDVWWLEQFDVGSCYVNAIKLDNEC